MLEFDETGCCGTLLRSGEYILVTEPDGNVPMYTVSCLTSDLEEAEVRWYKEYKTLEEAETEYNRWKDY
jgi:hypothetical protein